jgi:hypothetical protein
VTIRMLGAAITAAASFVLAILVALMPLDIEPAAPGITPAPYPVPPATGGLR